MSATASAHPRPAPGPALEAPETEARPPVSVVVLTLNEEVNIAECLRSCMWSDDVHVLDSGSQDRTTELAASMGAEVHHHPFESFGRQRNWAIDNIPMKHKWVFHLDADERFTPELVHEMAELLRDDPPEVGFHVPNKLMFMGRWLRRAAGYPSYQVRLFHKERMRFIDHGHGQREHADGVFGKLNSPYLHYMFSKGMYDWLDKHNRYSSLEALQYVREGGRSPKLAKLLSREPVERRRAWRVLSYRVPMWGAIRFLATLLVLGGILEGRAGWTYARLLALYEQMTAMKIRVLKAARRRDADVEFEQRPLPSTRIFESGDRMAADVAGAALPASRDGRRETPQLRFDEAGQMLPEASPWSVRDNILRVAWMLAGRPLFRLSFHNWYGVRRWLLRLFGARVGPGVRIRPSASIEIPWNLDLRDGCVIGDHAILYSLGRITVGERTIVSQYAHLCAGTHDHTDRRFPLIRDPIEIGPDAWIGADAFVGPNVRVGRLAVLGARASAYKDLEPQTVYAGNPARPLKPRELA